MSIKDFYLKLGNISLNFSLYFIMLATILTILLINQQQVLIAAGLLLIFSLIYYQIHLHYIKKSKLVSPLLKNSIKNPVLTPYLAEKINRNLYFFSPDGQAQFHTRILYRKIELFDHNRGIVTLKAEKEKRTNYHIYNSESKWVGMIYYDRPPSLVEIQVQHKDIVMVKNNSDLQFYRNSQKIAEIKKGWLPLKWTSLFRLNTPVITFQEKASELEKGAIMLAATLLLNK